MAFEAEKNEADIKKAIEKITGGKRYEVWTIGVTDNPSHRREEHGRPTIWHYWEVASEADANNTVAAYKSKGMKGYTGKEVTPAKYLYITWT